MARINPKLFLLSAIALGACAPLCEQTDPNAPSSHVKQIQAPLSVDDVAAGRLKQIPATVLLPREVPFAIDAQNTGVPQSIRVLSEGEMTREDRDLVANAESSIQERAGFENLEFNGEGWAYHQLVCPALPKHLFLRFTRDGDTRQVSMFSAAIPRDGNGRVHIIPIVRRGYSLFSPAPIGAMTIAAFNRIRLEEGAGASADWVGTGLCYAALAGANPRLAAPSEATEDRETGMTILPTLIVTDEGGAIIRIADVSAAPKPMEWSMTFDRKGKLIKATHAPAYAARFSKTIPAAADVDPARPASTPQP